MTEVIEHPLELRSIGSVMVRLASVGGKEVVTLTYGHASDGMLVRIQSRCLYGEVFGSTDCDCKDQLDSALDQIRAEGSGAVIYLDQEGRGHGLQSKARAYARLEESGIDTFTAYREMDLTEDARTYEGAVRALRDLEVDSVRLLSNNPHKQQALMDAGFGVERVPLVMQPRSEKSHLYLNAKRSRGHLV